MCCQVTPAPRSLLQHHVSSSGQDPDFSCSPQKTLLLLPHTLRPLAEVCCGLSSWCHQEVQLGAGISETTQESTLGRRCEKLRPVSHEMRFKVVADCFFCAPTTISLIQTLRTTVVVVNASGNRFQQCINTLDGGFIGATL